MKPISKNALSRLLSEADIVSGSIRLPSGHTPKGYYRKSFEDAFARYLPAENATSPQTSDGNDFLC
jgi:hypothetical protein